MLSRCLRPALGPWRTFAPSVALRSLITISQLLNESYTTHKIVPDVVDEFDTQGLLSVDYDNGNRVTLGNELAVDATQTTPQVLFTLNSPNQDGTTELFEPEDKFMVVLTDPDAPSNHDHKWLEYCHWIATDIPLSPPANKEDVIHTLDIANATQLVPYEGPAPPPSTGKHRYVFLLYKQAQAAKLPAPKDRPTWGTGVAGLGVRDWINKYGAGSKLLGVNFFYAKNPVQEES